MTLHLRVAPGLGPLVDALAAELAVPSADPFAAEVVAVPSEGVKAWLRTALSRRLGSDASSGGGIVANVDFVYPAALVRRALGDSHPAGRWSTGPLTWAVLEVLVEHGAVLQQQPTLVRARAVADLFDRYTLHRPAMVRRWEAGHDVDALGQPLDPRQLWQPALWRLLRERLGGHSDAELMAAGADELRKGALLGDLPGRVFLVGQASMPPPHLQVLAALAVHRDVHVFATAPSLAVWQRVVDALGPEALGLPLDRRADPTGGVAAHPLLATWGRPAREAHLLLLDATREVPSQVLAVPDAHHAGASTGSDGVPTVLQRLQRSISDDQPPAPDAGEPRSSGDLSLQWHRCPGPARQVEVLRDIVVRLLQEPDGRGGHRYEPRDITVVCPDVPAFAPFAVAAFAGDPLHGVPAVPLRVADRSLRADSPLLDAVGALLGLLDGRFRASDVLGFASLGPVRRRFALDTDALTRVGTWLHGTHVRWGLDADHRAEFGLPVEVTAHTWRAGLDQLLVGAAMADAGPRFGPGGCVPYGDVEGDDVAVVGRLADLLESLGAAVDALSGEHSPHGWCAALADASRSLFLLDDDDAHEWHELETVLADLTAEMQVADRPTCVQVAAVELAGLVGDRLGSRPGRPRFGSGAVTLSSLTAARGVPSRVMVLLGLDGDLGAAGVPSADDLAAAPACVGDRDPRSELRAQLLDAVMSAQDCLILVTTGRDVRTNAPVPPAVPVAELMDVVDALIAPSPRAAGGSPVRASELVAVDHPRQGWSERNFVPGELGVDGPWSFDTGALAAARSRRVVAAPGDGAPSGRPLLSLVLPPVEGGRREVTLHQLVAAMRNPVQSLLNGRLGVRLERDAEPIEDLIMLEAAGLDAWRIASDLLAARLPAGAAWTPEARDRWIAVQAASGRIPPLALGTTAVDEADAQVTRLMDQLDRVLCGELHLPEDVPLQLDVPVDGVVWRVTGEVPDVCGAVSIEISPTRHKPSTTITAWLRAAALTVTRGAPSSAVVIGKPEKGSDADILRVEMRSVAHAQAALALAVDLRRRAWCSVLPVLPATAFAYLTQGDEAAREAWEGKSGMPFRNGDGNDEWVSFVLPGMTFDELLDAPPLADESGEGWGDHPSRFVRWAERILCALSDTTTPSSTDGDAGRD